MHSVVEADSAMTSRCEDEILNAKPYTLNCFRHALTSTSSCICSCSLGLQRPGASGTDHRHDAKRFTECSAALERKTGVEQSLGCLPSRACHRSLPVKMHFARPVLVKGMVSFVLVVSPRMLLASAACRDLAFLSLNLGSLVLDERCLDYVQ